MTGQYDVALKQLLRVSAGSVLKQIIGSEIRIERWIETELRRAEHRRADLLGVTAGEELLHIELQSSNDPKMPLRMAEYAVAICRQFGRLPKQIVLYFGGKKLSMSSELRGPDPERPDFIFRYTTVDFRDLESGPLLESEHVEDNILAVLACLKDKAAAVRRILQQIATADESSRYNALAQLLILSELRDLSKTIEEEAERMPIIGDIRDHSVIGPWIRQGEEKGLQEGQRRGLEEGYRQTRQILLRQIERRFGPVSSELGERVNQLSGSQLDELALRLFDVESPEELFSNAELAG